MDAGDGVQDCQRYSHNDGECKPLGFLGMEKTLTEAVARIRISTRCVAWKPSIRSAWAGLTRLPSFLATRKMPRRQCVRGRQRAGVRCETIGRVSSCLSRSTSWRDAMWAARANADRAMHRAAPFLALIFALWLSDWAVLDCSAKEPALTNQPNSILEAIEVPGIPLPLLKPSLEAPASANNSALLDKLEALIAVKHLHDIEQKISRGVALNERDRQALAKPLRWVWYLYRKGDLDTAAYTLDRSLPLFVEAQLVPGLLESLHSEAHLDAQAMRLMLHCGLSREMLSLEENSAQIVYLRELSRDLQPNLTRIRSPLADGVLQFVMQKVEKALTEHFPENLPECARRALRGSQLRQNAENGIPHSQIVLGLIYCGKTLVAANAIVSEVGVREIVSTPLAKALSEEFPQSLPECAVWFLRAAKQGSPYAQAFLASMYASGKGMPQNFVNAYAWASIAAASGSEDAARGWAASRDFRVGPLDIDSVDKFRNLILFNNKIMTRSQAAGAQKLADELIEARKRLRESSDLALAFPDNLVGIPQVVDGDTIDINGQRVRLQGVDAPELAQECQDSSGAEYRCGQVAAVALEARLGDEMARCEIEAERDRYGRAIGVCFASDGTDINEWLVRNGWGLAYRKYSMRYVAQEEAAKVERLGMHEGRFVFPWDWRRDNRQ